MIGMTQTFQEMADTSYKAADYMTATRDAFLAYTSARNEEDKRIAKTTFVSAALLAPTVQIEPYLDFLEKKYGSEDPKIHYAILVIRDERRKLAARLSFPHPSA